MNKKIILAAALILGFCSTGHAYSLRSGVYIGMSAGGTYSRSKMNEKVKDNDTIFVSSLALGVRIRDIRLAAEATLNTKAEYEKFTYENNSVSAHSYYDIPVAAVIRPYFNFGGGIAESEITAEPNVSKKQKKPFWDVGGGFSVAITRATNVDLGYRYSRFSKESFNDTNGVKVNVENENHSVYLGVRHVF